MPPPFRFTEPPDLIFCPDHPGSDDEDEVISPRFGSGWSPGKSTFDNQCHSPEPRRRSRSPLSSSPICVWANDGDTQQEPDALETDEPAQLSQKLSRLRDEQTRLERMRGILVDDLARLARLIEMARGNKQSSVVDELTKRKEQAEELFLEVQDETRKLLQAESGVQATENSHVEALQQANQHAVDVMLAVEKTSTDHQALSLDLQAIESQRSQVEQRAEEAKKIQREIACSAQAWERVEGVLKNTEQQCKRLLDMHTQRPCDKAIVKQMKHFDRIRKRLLCERAKLQECCLYAERGERIERSIGQLQDEASRLAKLSKETAQEKEKLEKRLKEMSYENDRLAHKLQQTEQAQHDLDQYWAGLLESDDRLPDTIVTPHGTQIRVWCSSDSLNQMDFDKPDSVHAKETEDCLISLGSP